MNRPDARSVVLGLGLLGVFLLLLLELQDLAAVEQRGRVVLAALPAGVLGLAGLRRRDSGVLAAGLLAVVVAVVGRADQLTLVALGTLLLLVLGTVVPDAGLRPLRRVGAVVALGGASVVVVVVLAVAGSALEALPPVLTVLGGAVLGVGAIAANRSLSSRARRPASDDAG